MPEWGALLAFVGAGLLLNLAPARYDIHTWLNRAMGALFIGLGLRLALGGRQ